MQENKADEPKEKPAKEREYQFNVPQGRNRPDLIRVVKESDLTKDDLRELFKHLMLTVDSYPERVKEMLFKQVEFMLINEAEETQAALEEQNKTKIITPGDPEFRISSGGFGIIKGDA